MTPIYTPVWVKEENLPINELSRNMGLQGGRLVPPQLDWESFAMTPREPRTLQTTDSIALSVSRQFTDVLPNKVNGHVTPLFHSDSRLCRQSTE